MFSTMDSSAAAKQVACVRTCARAYSKRTKHSHVAERVSKRGQKIDEETRSVVPRSKQRLQESPAGAESESMLRSADGVGGLEDSFDGAVMRCIQTAIS